ncbi:hypothetical protein [Brevundimonas sp.]|uniref:hypothetical protein n=1 Tax=Brevundimonas sp. TaxID=1871086 RepID=UPI00289E479F|nr:hypothetical protein [Brevundimonas sp.]
MTETSDDLLNGCEAIAKYLGQKPRWVYQARESKWSCPIRKREGIGLYAFKSELDAWLRDETTLAHSTV